MIETEMYRIAEVNTHSLLRKFIEFPDILYRDCPQYVPALHSDQKKSLTGVSTLSYCKRKMWLVTDVDGNVAGRICGIINPRYNERYGRKRARFGWFDTVDDIEVARLLLGTAEAWAKENGMDEIHGPLYYNTLGKQGMLVEGFDNVPPFNCIYNYQYYSGLVEQLGYVKECDWVQYKVDVDQPVPEKIARLGGLLQRKYGIKEGSVDRLKKDRKKVREFFDVYNSGFADSVLNFIPFTDEEIDEEAKAVMPFISDRLCSVLTGPDDRLAAFGIVFPSMSAALQKARGRLFPTGWIHILRAMYGRNDTLDMMLNGAAPQWQNTGISSVFHIIMAEKMKEYGAKTAITNPQIESNSAAFVWARYKSELYMRRRCYIKTL